MHGFTECLDGLRALSILLDVGWLVGLSGNLESEAHKKSERGEEKWAVVGCFSARPNGGFIVSNKYFYESRARQKGEKDRKVVPATDPRGDVAKRAVSDKG